MKLTEMFYFDDKPIEDMEKFCRENNTKMIRYKAQRRVPNSFDGKARIERKSGQMPEMFFNNLRMTDGWVYTKVDRKGKK